MNLTNEEIVKELNKVAKSMQLISEGTRYEVESGSSWISPAFAFSFTKPFYICDGVVRATTWYHVFRNVARNYKNGISWGALNTLNNNQNSNTQSMVYSPYFKKIHRGWYQPTEALFKLVKEIEYKVFELF